MEAVFRADGGNAGDVNVRTDYAMGADFHMFIDHTVRANVDCGVEVGFRMDDRCWMNHRAKSEASERIAKRKNFELDRFKKTAAESAGKPDALQTLRETDNTRKLARPLE